MPSALAFLEEVGQPEYKAPLPHRIAVRGRCVLEGNYEIWFGLEQVGKVQVLRQGLYYRFFARCRISGDVVCRLQVTCGDARENLGVMVPVDGGFGLDTRLPVKRLGTGIPEFRLVTKNSVSEGKFCPIYPEEPFAYIAKLKEGFLVRKGGQVGLVLKEL